MYAASLSIEDVFKGANEPRREKTSFFAYAKTKTQLSSEADQRLVFATYIVQSLYFLNTKFQASNHLVWLYSLVCVRPGRKSRRPVFSQRGSNNGTVPDIYVTPLSFQRIT